MKIVYMGTPDFAVPPLESIVAAGHTVAMVYTQPDRPAGRGNKLRKPPVKVAAEALNLPIAQPNTLKGEEGATVLQDLATIQPDLIVVAAYGQILPKSLLALPEHGCVNLHASLLPRWRGASPIQAAIRAGDPETGVTLMLMDEGLDTGAMLVKKSISIDEHDTAGSLHDSLSALAASMVVPGIEAWVDGKLVDEAQNDASSSYAPMLKKRDGWISWDLDAQTLCNHVRAMIPWPGAQAELAGVSVRLGAARMAGDSNEDPGTIFSLDGDRALVSTGDGAVSFQTIHPAGKRSMPFSDFLSGRRLDLPIRFKSPKSSRGEI
jgi:methionyl-tRNA formyltransferase